MSGHDRHTAEGPAGCECCQWVREVEADLARQDACTCPYYEANSGPGGKAVNPDCPVHGAAAADAPASSGAYGIPQATGYPGPVRLEGDNIVKPWRYRGP